MVIRSPCGRAGGKSPVMLIPAGGADDHDWILFLAGDKIKTSLFLGGIRRLWGQVSGPPFPYTTRCGRAEKIQFPN